MDNQERHYNINKLNIIFALASITLLIALISLFRNDYDREWKDYQRKFREMEVEKARGKYAEETSALEQNAEYQETLANLKKTEEALGNKGQELAAAEKVMNTLQARQDITSQNFRFAKAALDAARYEYETALGHGGHGNLDKLKSKLEEIEQQAMKFRLAAEEATQAVAAQQKILDTFTTDLKELEKTQRTARKQAEILERKLKRIDPQSMTMANKIAERVRNLPILDLANPSYKVDQIVLKDLTDDVNFMGVPKVDRCVTCHLGINNPDYADAPQPFRTHPKLDLFVDGNSAHPMEEFGCTTCHGGRGRGTDFVSSVHVPSTPEQAKEWEEKYGWHQIHHWDNPMMPLPYTEASCFKCHSGETVIKGAEKLNLGLNLIERAGCYGCHTIEKYKDWPKVGPDLNHLASKSRKEWVYQWIENPQSFRHNTWMPAFFGQSNNDDPASIKQTQQEIHAMVAYLFAHTKPFEMAPVPFTGDAKRGEELVAAIGCFGCHQVAPEPLTEKATRESLHREHGPNLIGLGTKTDQKWLYNWLKDPERYHPGTRMPSLRLSDQEAADIAQFLASHKNAEFNQKPIPPVDESTITEIAGQFLTRSMTVAESRQKIATMNLDEKLLFTGEKLIRHYGCFACHNIAGFENEKPIGTELTEEGSKPVDRFDFGFVDIEHNRHAWFAQKLKDPRIFDQDRVKLPDEKLRMPNYYFSNEEVEAIVTALMGFVKDTPPASKLPARTPQNLFIEEGQELVRQFNCQGCHIIEGEGGAVQSSVKDWLIKYENRQESEAGSLVTSFSAPNLIGEGAKVQAEWLFNFLHHPTTIRPWLKMRMPTFHFNAAHLNVFLKYFNALDNQDFPYTQPVDAALTPEEYEAAEKLFSDDYFGCAQCHIVGNKMPSGSPDRWAPNFALAKSRLKPEWIIDWLKDPQKLMPGTKMPTYFDPQYFNDSGPDDLLKGDEHQQIRVLRNYLLTLSDAGKETGKTKTPPAPAQPAAQTAPAPAEGATPTPSAQQ